MKSHLLIGIGSVLLSAILAPAEATLVTSSAGFTSPTVYNFSAYAGCTSFAASCGAPPQTLIGTSIAFTGTPGSTGSALYNGPWGLLANGTWNGSQNGFAGNNGRTPGDFARFTFSTGVSSVGGFVNYVPGNFNGGAFTLLAYGSANNLLESYNIETLAPISTPSATNAGAFRGITRSSADIFAFEFQNGVSVLDNLTFSAGSSVVPEPSLLSLMFAGLLGVAISRRRKA